MQGIWENDGEFLDFVIGVSILLSVDISDNSGVKDDVQYSNLF